MKMIRPLAAAVALGTALGVFGLPVSVQATPQEPTSHASEDTTPSDANARRRKTDTDSVIVISVDALTPQAIRRLGRRKAPHIYAFQRAGASTLNARSQYEQTLTLPNHTGMVTGRRILPRHGGHGVTWNDERTTPRSVHAAAGHRVESVFTVVHRAGGNPALFASKSKFSLWRRSWPKAVDRTVLVDNNYTLVDRLTRDITRTRRDFRFLHLALPDTAAHQRGFMSKHYLQAVRDADTLVGKVVNAVERDPRLRGRTTIILTSDHGGRAGHTQHKNANDRLNHRIPFMVRGPGIIPRTNLYDLNPRYRDPGGRVPGYGVQRQPIRNAAVANLALDLLGLGPVPGSQVNREQDLEVVMPAQAQSWPSSFSSASPMVPS